MNQHLKTNRSRTRPIKPKIDWNKLPKEGKARSEFLEKVCDEVGQYSHALHTFKLSENEK